MTWLSNIRPSRDLKLGPKFQVKGLKHLNMSTKLIGSFICLSLVAGLGLWVALRLTFNKITEDTIPTLKVMEQTVTSVHGIRAVALEFAVTGEEEAIEHFSQFVNKLQKPSGLSESRRQG